MRSATAASRAPPCVGDNKTLLSSAHNVQNIENLPTVSLCSPCPGLPPQHLYYSPAEHHASPSPSAAAHKYHENGSGQPGPGQDNFSDFVSLVCQEPPGPSRSPKVSSGYYSSMYPPPPPPPMSRPVPLVRPSDPASSPPVSGSPAPAPAPGPGHPEHHGLPGSYEMMGGSMLAPGTDHHASHDGKQSAVTWNTIFGEILLIIL